SGFSTISRRMPAFARHRPFISSVRGRQALARSMIPTDMTERHKALLVLALFVVAIVVIGGLLNAAGVPLFFVAIARPRAAWSARSRSKKRISLGDLLAALRAQDADTRERTLLGIKPAALRDYLRSALAADGSDERAGDVERFPFPRSLQRGQRVIWWTAWG